MVHTAAIGLFCEDIREERSGQDTIIGVLPDRINITSLPGMLPKLCLYVRVHVSPPEEVGPIVARIIMPDGKTLAEGKMEDEKIEQSRSKAAKDGHPYMGVILKFVIAPLPITQEGRISAEVDIGGRKEKEVCGALHLNLLAPA
jgi:hypothetical protein